MLRLRAHLLPALLLPHNDIAIVPPQLHIVIRELAQLRFIKTHAFLFSAGAQAKARHEVHEEEDDAGAEEGVCEAGHAVGELVRELDVVVIEPAARDLGEAVEVRDVVAVVGLVRGFQVGIDRRGGERGDYQGEKRRNLRSEESRQQVPYDAADAVLCEDI